MYRKPKYNNNTIQVNNTYEGETIEQKIERMVSNREPITDGAPMTYTERKDGVNPDYNIRTDRWEHAIEGMDKATKSWRAKREGKAKIVDMPKGDGGAESIAGTGNNAK